MLPVFGADVGSANLDGPLSLATQKFLNFMPVSIARACDVPKSASINSKKAQTPLSIGQKT
jgi:hypothetical protein